MAYLKPLPNFSKFSIEKLSNLQKKFLQLSQKKEYDKELEAYFSSPEHFIDKNQHTFHTIVNKHQAAKFKAFKILFNQNVDENTTNEEIQEGINYFEEFVEKLLQIKKTIPKKKMN